MGTTTLLHESFIRLVNAAELRLVDRRHFFAYAARTMRNVIIDSAREHLAERRGGGAAHETLGGDAALQVADTHVSEELIRVSEALRELEAIDPELAELVDMRYFGGYSEAEIAELQGITDRTVRRRWDKARAWLYVALSDSPLPPPDELKPGLDPAVQRQVGRQAFAHLQPGAQLPARVEPARTDGPATGSPACSRSAAATAVRRGQRCMGRLLWRRPPVSRPGPRRAIPPTVASRTPARRALQRGSVFSSRSGMTLTATPMLCPRPPRITPRSGTTSAKSAPQARVM